jgi:hypothetical protein
LANLGGFMEISKEVWKEMAALLYKHKIPYTTNVTKDDKHIQINLTIPNYYECKWI